LVPVLTVALSAALVGAVAAPAQARAVRDDRMPVTVSARLLGTAPAPSTTTATRVVPTWPTPVRSVTRVSATSPEVAEVVRLVNVARKKAGCASVHTDARLAAAARLHSEDMARRNYFSHTSLDGRTPWDRIRAQGYAYGSAENIAAGYATPAAVMTGWMNSKGHKANILNCSNKALGVGVGRGGSYGIYWTQDFGSR
jgi:uncharacterized protein YkwD